MQTSGLYKLSFHPGLEGLRGVAVGVVLLFHAGYDWMQGGFLGVSTFFTLSGFLITGLLVSGYERSGRVDLLAFWGRRFRRLMPAALLTLAGIALLGPLAADFVQQARLRADGLAALLYAANWWLIASDAAYVDLMGSPSLAQHFWSLAIEEQYYVVYPLMTAGTLVLARGSRRGLGLLLTVLTLASWFWMAWLAGTSASNARIYFGTDTRAAELLAGGVLALLTVGRRSMEPGVRRTTVSCLGVLGLVVSGWYWNTASTDSQQLYTGGLVIYTAASVAVVAAAILPAGPVRMLLSLGALRWLGRISYGAYLYHWPVFLLLGEENTGLMGLQLTVVRIGLTLVLAEASYRWLEEPIRTGRRILAWRRWVIPPLAAGGVAAAIIAATLDAPPMFADATPGALSSKAAAADAPRILVVGDSVSVGIARGLASWARATGEASVRNAGRTGCGIARGFRTGKASRRERICDDWSRRLEAPLLEQKSDLVLVYTSGWDLIQRRLPDWERARAIGDPAFDVWLRSEFEAALDLLSQRGAHVVWLSALCAVDRKGGRTTGVFDLDRVRRLNRDILRPLVEAHPYRSSFIDLFAEICPGGQFANEYAGIRNLRRDGIHFSPAGAKWVGHWLGPQLLPLARREARSQQGVHE